MKRNRVLPGTGRRSVAWAVALATVSVTSTALAASFALVMPNGKCIDVNGPEFDGRNNGARVQMWDCHGGPNQQWRVEGTAVIASNGKCLDVHAPDFEGRTNGGRVQ